MRHDALLRLIMAMVQQEWNCDAAMEDKELASGSSDPTATKPYSKVDLIIWCPDMRPCVIAIDATVASPTLPSYITETLKGNLFDDAAEIKNANHLQGCNERERGFLPIVSMSTAAWARISQGSGCTRSSQPPSFGSA